MSSLKRPHKRTFIWNSGLSSLKRTGQRTVNKKIGFNMNVRLSEGLNEQSLYLRNSIKIQHIQHNPAFLIMKFTPNPPQIISDQEMNINHNNLQNLIHTLIFSKVSKWVKFSKTWMFKENSCDFDSFVLLSTYGSSL